MTSSLEAPPQVAINDFESDEAFLAAIDATIKYFNDGDIVSGTVVKVDRDEVLLDIGYKTEGVIPSKELSIKHDVDPFDVVSVGEDFGRGVGRERCGHGGHALRADRVARVEVERVQE